MTEATSHTYVFTNADSCLYREKHFQQNTYSEFPRDLASCVAAEF